MKEVTVLENQSLLDIAIRHCGSMELLFEIARLNSISVTKKLQAGELIKVPVVLQENKRIVEYYKTNNIQPGTDYLREEVDSYLNVSADFLLINSAGNAQFLYIESNINWIIN